MSPNPYEAPQSAPKSVTRWTQHGLILILRTMVADIALALALYCLITFPFITFHPNSRDGVYQIPAMLGCAGLLHPNGLPFCLDLISLLVLGILKLLAT